jgi:hypothetical protein
LTRFPATRVWISSTVIGLSLALIASRMARRGPVRR